MIIDTHCHLHEPVFADVRETLATATSHGVWGIIGVGCDPETNARTLTAATRAPKGIWACLGFHPEWAQLGDRELEQVERQVAEEHPRILGIGEIGLPWYSLEGVSDASARMATARRHLDRLLALAARWDLPVALHAPHDTAAIALECLRARGLERAVFHWHKAAAEVTRAIVDAGYYVSVTPEVVYRERDREMVEAVPLESLLVETDGPWPYRGEFDGLPSGPWFASRVAEEIAKIKKLPVEDVMVTLGENTCNLFEVMWT